MASPIESPEWLDALADIEWPAPPDWTPLYLAVTGALIITVTITCYYVLRRRRAPSRETTRDRALARLAALQHDWQRGTIDDRAAAYRLATILRLGLGLTQLMVSRPAPPHIEPHAWRAALETLERQRYASGPTQQLPAALFHTVRGWLQRVAAA